MNIDDLAKHGLKLIHTLTLKPEYIHAIGLVSIEVSSLEGMLARLLELTLHVKDGTARDIYFAANSMTVRLAILEAASGELPPAMKRKLRSLIGRTRGIASRRHEIVHDFWMFDSATDLVHRVAQKKSGDRPLNAPVSLAVLNALVRDIQNVALEASLLIALMQHPLPSTAHVTSSE